MPDKFKHEFDTPVFKGIASINTSLFIDGKWTDPVDGGLVEVMNPSTGTLITKVGIATSKDVDIAVEAAKKAYHTAWGLKVPGAVRGRILNKLADLIEGHADELAAIESMDTGKLYDLAKNIDIIGSAGVYRYYAGWADKVHGKVIETTENALNYTRHEPFGVCGQIVPWNYPFVLLTWKLAPALATGNTVVLKPSEVAPLSALRLADLLTEAGVPPGVVNIIPGFGHDAGQAMSEHPHIDKISFTGSTLAGRKVMEAAAKSNLKSVTLELGGKSPNIIFDDANLDQALKWATFGIFSHMGQVCAAGSRIFVQEGIYPAFIAAFSQIAQGLGVAVGDPFEPESKHGPQASQVHFDRIMGYIQLGKDEGATLLVGGEKYDRKGYYIQPTVFTDCKPDMRIVKEEIFGPVAVIIKFKTEEEAIQLANNTRYGLACAVFTENGSRGVRVAHSLEAGSAFINCYNTLAPGMPFGGFKQSGFGRELGEYALSTYTQLKAVHMNIGLKI